MSDLTPTFPSPLKRLRPTFLALWDVMRNDVRHERLISQHIDVALVYKEMLGPDEALAYLKREHIPRDIAERVLLTRQKREVQAASTRRRRERLPEAVAARVLAGISFPR